MLPLDDPTWKTLRHAGGDASNFPSVIERLRVSLQTNSEVDDRLIEDAWDICHQWSTYDATYAAFPHLVDLCRSVASDHPLRLRLLQLCGWCSGCLALNRTPAPDAIVVAYSESLKDAQTLILESISNGASLEDTRQLLAAFATCRGDNEFGMVLFELEGGSVACPSCSKLIKPMKSTINPFYTQNKQLNLGE